MIDKRMVFSTPQKREDVRNAIVDFVTHYFDDKGYKKNGAYDHSVSLKEKEQNCVKLILSEAYDMANLDQDKVPLNLASKNGFFNAMAFEVISDVVDMVLPNTVIPSIGMYAETRNIAYGDSNSFIVKPNDLFVVSQSSFGKRTAEFKKVYNGQVTVLPVNHQISVEASLYRVLCGLESLGDFVFRAVRSMETLISTEVYYAFDNFVSQAITTAGNTNLVLNGWSQKGATKLAQRVTAWNAGLSSAFVGTKLALANVLPDNANYRYELESDFVRMGYIREIAGTPTLELPQIADYSSNDYGLVMNDDRIYVMSTSGQKFVKLVFEGDTRTNNIDFYRNADLTASTTLYKSWGTGIASNAVMGVIELQ